MFGGVFVLHNSTIHCIEPARLPQAYGSLVGLDGTINSSCHRNGHICVWIHSSQIIINHHTFIYPYSHFTAHTSLSYPFQVHMLPHPRYLSEHLLSLLLLPLLLIHQSLKKIININRTVLSSPVLFYSALSSPILSYPTLSYHTTILSSF